MDDDRRNRLLPGNQPQADSTCLGSTCMKWGGDGELAPQDLQSILARLSAVDGEASGLMECPVDPG